MKTKLYLYATDYGQLILSRPYVGNDFELMETFDADIKSTPEQLAEANARVKVNMTSPKDKRIVELEAQLAEAQSNA